MRVKKRMNKKSKPLVRGMGGSRSCKTPSLMNDYLRVSRVNHSKCCMNNDLETSDFEYDDPNFIMARYKERKGLRGKIKSESLKREDFTSLTLCGVAGSGSLVGIKGPRQYRVDKTERDVLRTDRPIGGSVDGSSTSGSADGSLAPSCLSKPPDSIKNWADHFFWVDSRVFPISVPLYTGGVLEKDPAPHLTARQEQAVQVLSSNKAPFRRYPECFLALVGLSPYYPFGENTYPAFEGPDRTDMGLLDYIRTADPRKVQAVEVQKGEEQVTLFDSIKHCFVSLNAPAAAHQASGSGSGAGAEVSVSSTEGNIIEENVIPEGAFLNLTDPECDVPLAEKDVAQKQPEKAKRKKLLKRSDPLPAKRLRIDHPSLASGTGGKSLASLRRSLPEGSLSLGASSPADIPTHVTEPSRLDTCGTYVGCGGFPADTSESLLNLL
ncbi:hypothetical protein Tco_1458397 [Tanacetum coccineum]